MTLTSTTEERVTTVALHLFGRQGYPSTSMEQVRREAGVSNGSLYHLFPNKAALAARLYCDGMLDRPFAVLHALWMGPTQEFCRQWLRGRGRLRPRHVAADLADGAWRAVTPS